MARYRRRYKRQSIGKIVAKRTGSKTAGNVAQVAMAGYKLAKRVARLVNTEIKTYSADGVTQTSNAGRIIDLCDPSQGDGTEERVGNQVKPLHLTLRGYVYPDASGGSAQVLRVIVFRYKDENGQTLVVNDVLDNDHTSTNRIVLAGKEFDNRYHSKILFDKVIPVGYDAASGIPGLKFFKFSTKLFGHINWTNATTTQEGGGLYMLLCSTATNEADAPLVQWVSRVTYTDN